MVFQYFLGISFNLISPSSIFHFLLSEYSTVIWFSFWWQRWWRIRRGEGRMFESHLDQSTLNKTDPLYYDCLLYELTFLWVWLEMLFNSSSKTNGPISINTSLRKGYSNIKWRITHCVQKEVIAKFLMSFNLLIYQDNSI